MKLVGPLVLLLLGFAFGSAYAGTQAFGFELGVTTIDQVRGALPKQAKVTEQGSNTYTNGPQFKTDGASLDLEGLNEVAYVFDEQKKLSAVLLTMNKERIDSVLAALTSKYKIAKQERPFVGNQYVRFNTADAVIELSAPHMSFEMSINYIRNDLMKKFTSQSAAEAASKRKREAEKF